MLLDAPPAWLAPVARVVPGIWLVTSPGWDLVNLLGEARRIKGATAARRASPANAKARSAHTKILGLSGTGAGAGVLLLGMAGWLATRRVPKAAFGAVLLGACGLGCLAVGAALWALAAL